MHCIACEAVVPGTALNLKKKIPMSTNPTFWQRAGMHNWFLKKEAGITETASLTPDLVYKYIIEKFQESIC